MYLYDDTYAAPQIWGGLLDVWVSMCSENCVSLTEYFFVFVCVCVCVCVVMNLTKEQIIIIA